MRTAVAWIAMLLLAHPGVSPAPVGANVPLPTAAHDPWIEARTSRFCVLTSGDVRVAQRAARTLERLATTLERTATGLNVDGGGEIRVYVFRDHASFRPYSPYPDDEHGTTPGFHVSADDVELIAYFTPHRESGMRFAAHEYLHAVISRNFARLPVWANEGIAEFYSTFETRGRTASVGGLIPEHVVWLRDHMLPVEDLLLTTADSHDYRGGERRATIYAQSWGLVHSLVMDPVEDGRRFGRLIRELERGTASLQALRSVYGPDAPDSLTRSLRSAARIGVFRSMTWDFAEEFEAVPVVTRDLEAVEVSTLLGELLASSNDQPGPSARAHLENAWSADSSRPRAAALLGAMADRRGDREDAARWFAAVSRRPGRDPRAWAIAGNTLAQRALRSGEPFRGSDAGPSADALAARTFLSGALASRPDAAEWLVPLALTYLNDAGDSSGVQQAIGALLTAQATTPRRTDIVGALAVLQLHAGNRSASLFQYRNIPPGQTRAYWRGVSGGLIVASALKEAQQLVRDGRYVAAESLAAGVCRTVTETSVSSTCDGFLAWAREARTRADAPRSPPSPGDSRATPVGGGLPTDRGSTQGGVTVAGRIAARDLLSRASRAIAAGDFASAEILCAEEEQRQPAGARRARLDSLTAHARSLRRFNAVESLLHRGAVGEACALLALIIDDRPPADLRRQAEARRARFCRR